MPVLLKWKADWADEFDMVGIILLSDKEWNDFMEAVKRIPYPQEFYFGTNEYYVFESPEELLQGINSVTDLTLQDEETLKKFFPPLYEGQRPEFGWNPVDQVMEALSDEDYQEITGEVP